MEMHFTPQVQAQLDQVARETGRPAEAFVNDILAEYFDERAQVRETLDRRYDDIKSGRVALISGEEVRAQMREKSNRYSAEHG
jgi:hypothetical protein